MITNTNDIVISIILLYVLGLFIALVECISNESNKRTEALDDEKIISPVSYNTRSRVKHRLTSSNT